tara:strand:- start:715 stop:1704 length:990 start_codon:yes stop_codon:yes gene_type:complete
MLELGKFKEIPEGQHASAEEFNQLLAFAIGSYEEAQSVLGQFRYYLADNELTYDLSGWEENLRNLLHQNSLGTADAVLTVDIVEAEKDSPWTERFSDFTRIEDAAAQLLAGLDFIGNCLHLGGLTELSDSVAASLGGLKPVETLYLDGLISLSDRAAKSLVKVECDELSLNGITSLSVAAAESLSKHEAEIRVNLDNLSESAAAIIQRHWSFMTDLTDLSETDAEKIVAQGGLFILPCVSQLSDTVAEILGKHEGGRLNLRGLRELSDAAAESLSKHEGGLSLDGLTELSDAAAESLSKRENKFKSWELNLANLPASAAKILRDAGHGE